MRKVILSRGKEGQFGCGVRGLIDDLIRESQLLAQDATAALTTLELKGMVKQVGGMQYIRAVRG